MKGDFTRDTFDAKNQYSRVLMQQGRVQLDADWNERDDIVNHYLRTLARDLIGPHGGPTDDLGFEITKTVPEGENPLQAGDFFIGPGRYYVEGILVENHQWVRYSAQPSAIDYSTLDSDDFLVYLDVWERHVTHLEDERIREVALGGPDTATRAQVVWQVKVIREALDCSAVGGLLRIGSGRLKARARLDKPPLELCAIPPDSRYRGAENHLYRVEIHESGIVGRATFKWSRENGSVAFKVPDKVPDAPVISHSVELADLGRDARLGLTVNDWVELTDEDAVLHNRASPLLRVAAIDRETMAVTLDGTVTATGRNRVLRRWDHGGGHGALPFKEEEWITLEDGVQVRFEGPESGEPEREYRTGDFWLIPARFATGDVEWPSELDSGGNRLPAALPPRGPRHSYAPLAVHHPDATSPFKDCRCYFERLSVCPDDGSGEGEGEGNGSDTVQGPEA